MLDGGADRDELGHVLAPFIAADVEPDANDAVGADAVGLLLHARHRQLARVVHGLGEDRHLLALLPRGLLVADVVDRRADDQAQRVEAGVLDEQELVDRQVGGEEAALVLLQARPSDVGDALQGGGVVGLAHGWRAPWLTVGVIAIRDAPRLRTAVPAMWKVTIRSSRLLPSEPTSRVRTSCEMSTPTMPSAFNPSVWRTRFESASSRAV